MSSTVSVNSAHTSAQPCGCDAGAHHVCAECQQDQLDVTVRTVRDEIGHFLVGWRGSSGTLAVSVAKLEEWEGLLRAVSR